MFYYTMRKLCLCSHRTCLKMQDLPYLMSYPPASNTTCPLSTDPSLLTSIDPAGTFWSPAGDVTAKDMAGKVMMFTVGAFAAMDMGQANRVEIDPAIAQKPTPAQVVHVQWMWACIVLGVIPFTQGLVLLCVIAWANKAVIRDDGYLATAQLLAPIVNKLGDRGSVLTSDEIADELGNYRVVYGPRFPAGTARGQEHEVIKRLGIIAEDEGVDRWHGRMPGGKYD
jgi:hypothetical protein